MPKKQKSGLYRAKITVQGQSIYISAKTVKQLEQKKVEMREHLLTGNKPREMTFHQLVIEWWESIKKPSIKRPGTIAAYRSIINNWVIGHTDSRQMARAVRRVDLQRLLDECCESCGYHRVVGVKSLLAEICAYGMQIGLFAADYSKNCKINKQDDTVRKQALDDDQITRLLDAAEGRQIAPVVYCMYYLGLRYGETAGLLWGDLDWENGTVHIHQQVDSCTNNIGPVKTSSGNRIIPMPEQFMRLMYPMRGLPNAFVSPYRRRAHFDIEWFKLLDAAGAAHYIEGTPKHYHNQSYKFDYTPHQIRHTYVTKLYEAGVDPVAASRIVGHSSYSVTADIYTSISKQRQQSDAEKIKNAFREKGGSAVAEGNE